MFKQELVDLVLSGDVKQRKYICEADFRYFLLYYYSDYIKSPFASFHFDIFDSLMDLDNGNIRELGLIMFRESAKTSIIKPYLTWLILYHKRNYILVDSYEKQNSEKILTDVMNQLITNKRILSDFGRFIPISKDKDDEERKPKRISNFVTSNGVMVEAVSTQESVRGRLHKSFRPDCIIADDFENNKTKDSERMTEKVIEHFNEALTGMDSKGCVIYLGNYITEKGSVQWLFNRASTDEKIKVYNIPLIDKDGNPTWKEKYALTDIDAIAENKVSIAELKRKVSPSVFQVEYMNNPFAQDGAIFKKDWFKYCRLSDVDSRTDMSVYITIDTSTAEGSDFTGVIINYIDPTDKWHIRGERLKIDSGKLVDNLFSWYNMYKPISIGIEKTTYTMGFQSSLELEQRKRGIFLPIVELKHGGKKKEERIKDNLEYRYSNNAIVHIEGYTKEIEDELLKFPLGIHDDLIDALAYQVQVAETYTPVKVTQTKMYV